MSSLNLMMDLSTLTSDRCGIDPARFHQISDMETPRFRASRSEALLPGTGRCRPLRHPSHPASVGLACRPVGACRRQLMKQGSLYGNEPTRCWTEDITREEAHHTNAFPGSIARIAQPTISAAQSPLYFGSLPQPAWKIRGTHPGHRQIGTTTMTTSPELLSFAQGKWRFSRRRLRGQVLGRT